MELVPGDVLHIFCIFTKPTPKFKYVTCICSEIPLFFLINSEPRRITPDAQVIIKKDDGHSFLTKEISYINTATVCTFDQLEIEQAKTVGHLSENARKEVIKIVLTCDYLTPNQKEVVSKNLS